MPDRDALVFSEGRVAAGDDFANGAFELLFLRGEAVIFFEEGLNAAEQSCHAIALWHDCVYAQVPGGGLTKDFVKHCVENNRGGGQLAAKEEGDFHTIRVGHGEV